MRMVKAVEKSKFAQSGELSKISKGEPDNKGDGPDSGTSGEDKLLSPDCPIEEEAKKKPAGLDYWLGTAEGRSRLLVIFWVTSVAFMAFGYILIFWIWMHGRL